MRDKEAADIERKTMSRALEKQSQAVEKLLTTEKTLLARVVRMILYDALRLRPY